MHWLVLDDKRRMLFDFWPFIDIFVDTIFIWLKIMTLTVGWLWSNIIRTWIILQPIPYSKRLLRLRVGIRGIPQHNFFAIINVIKIVQTATAYFPVSVNLLKFFVLFLIVGLKIFLNFRIFFRWGIFVKLFLFVVCWGDVSVVITVSGFDLRGLHVGEVW